MAGLAHVGRCIDCIDDPNAPKANSVVPSVVATVQHEQDRVLLVHKSDNDVWHSRRSRG